MSKKRTSSQVARKAVARKATKKKLSEETRSAKKRAPNPRRKALASSTVKETNVIDVRDDDQLPEGVTLEDDVPKTTLHDGEKRDGDENKEDEPEEEIVIELPKDLVPQEDKPSSREEDYALIDKIRDGDRYAQDQAYRKLLSKYRSQIYNLILKIVHNPNEVEDLVQESFSKAFNSIANFNKEFAFSTWLYRIATNSSIDFLRKRRLKTFSIDNPIKTKDDEYTMEIPDSTSEPGKNIMQSQRDALVQDAIQHLPAKYRKVIEMRHLQERTYEEIAEDLKLPLGTVKAHIFRAREMLYKMLRDKLRNF
jgi:RNA polymerase sigma-70 factor (ECF subfamily)